MAIEAGTSTYYQAKRGIVQDGLVLHLDAGVKESYSGGTTWRDLSGNGNDAALTGTYEYSRSEYPCVKFNNGYQVNGDGRGIVNFTTLPSSDNTIECIFKINRYLSTTSNMQTSLFTSGRHSGCAYLKHFGTYKNNNNGLITYNSAFWYVAGQIDGGSGPTIFVDNVYHLVVTMQTNSIKYYSNNNLSWHDTRNVTQFGFSGIWAIANSKCLAQNNGVDIDFYSLRVYNKALSVDEVSRNYNATRHRFGL